MTSTELDNVIIQFADDFGLLTSREDINMVNEWINNYLDDNKNLN